MLDKSQWQHLIPHRDLMCLLDEVVSFDDERLHARSRSHQRHDNPLRSGDRLRALHLCEYGAQAMALHGGLLAQRDGAMATPGLLVSLRAVRLALVHVDDLPEAVDVYAERLMATTGSWQYEFRIEHAARVLVSGRAAVMLDDRASPPSQQG